MKLFCCICGKEVAHNQGSLINFTVELSGRPVKILGYLCADDWRGANAHMIGKGSAILENMKSKHLLFFGIDDKSIEAEEEFDLFLSKSGEDAVE